MDSGNDVGTFTALWPLENKRMILSDSSLWWHFSGMQTPVASFLRDLRCKHDEVYGLKRYIVTSTTLRALEEKRKILGKKAFGGSLEACRHRFSPSPRTETQSCLTKSFTILARCIPFQWL